MMSWAGCPEGQRGFFNGITGIVLLGKCLETMQIRGGLSRK